MADPNGWFRILPVGAFARFGREVTVTSGMVREMATNFGAVPETGVPVTRAHDDTAGKVGDLVQVTARADGLWGRIRWNADGVRLLADGAFRYFSPEVVWGPTDYDGVTVRNVLTGLSLVNRPFFGRAVSLFWLRPQKYQQKEETHMKDKPQETTQQQQEKPQPPQKRPSLIERLLSWLANQVIARVMARLWPEGQQAQQRVDELEDAAAEHSLRQRFGALEMAGLGKGWGERLVRVARIDAALADEIATRFRALLAQGAQAALFGEIGASGNDAAGPVERFNAAVKSAMHTYGLDHAAAGQKIAAEQPELYSDYQRAVTNRL
jgi:phage I-like protein